MKRHNVSIYKVEACNFGIDAFSSINFLNSIKLELTKTKLLGCHLKI